MRIWIMGFAFAAVPAWAQVTVEQPWSRATPPGARVAAGFMTLRNAGGSAVRVVGAASPVAGRVEMHVTASEGGVMKMREVGTFEVPAGGAVELKPGGAHLMLVELNRPLKAGERVPLTLRLARGDALEVELHVEAMGARRPARGR